MIYRKAQTEIIGVALIVVIIVIAGVLFLSMRRVSSDDNSSLTDPELAQSLLNTLMDTKTEKNVIVSDIINDCYSNRNDFCRSSTINDCCEYARKTMGNALEATLGEWGRSYRLTVEKGSDKRIEDIPEDSECRENSQQWQPGTYYTPSVKVMLRICRN
jgi:flagellin-like protein